MSLADTVTLTRVAEHGILEGKVVRVARVLIGAAGDGGARDHVRGEQARDEAGLLEGLALGGRL